MAERVLPNAFAIEQAALGSVLIRPSSLDDLADLEVDDFLNPQHRDIFEAMRSLAERRRAVDFATLADELKTRGLLGRMTGGESYLIKLANAVPTAESAAHYAKVVAQKATLRRMIATCAEVASFAYGDVGDVEEFLAETRAKFSAIETRGGSDLILMADDIADVMDEIGKRGEDPDSYSVQTGIPTLDDALGGLHGGELIVIAANPSRGKTALAWNTILRAAGAGIPCALFSLEMTRRQMIERGIAFEGKINGRNIVRGKMTSDEWRRAHAAATRLYDRKVWINQRKMTAKRICADARRWASRFAVDPKTKKRRLLIGIDYLGLVKHEKEGLNRSREIGEMTQEFKGLAKELDCAVVLLAQLNRENMKTGKDAKPRAPIMSDLRDSGEIEQDADVVLFPWWEGEPEAGKPHPASIIVGKQRNGPIGPVPCQWEREFMTFSGVEPGEPEQTRIGWGD